MNANPTPDPPVLLFGWHEAARGIVIVDPETRNGPMVPVAQLQALGWAGTEADYRASLPRLDPSPLAMARPTLSPEQLAGLNRHARRALTRAN